MYNITREQAADMLNISTRSIDRYIKAWKLRSKKDWKIVYIHWSDIDNFLNPSSKQEIIINHWTQKEEVNSTDIVLWAENSSTTFKIYEDLKEQIREKDEEIKNLNFQIWKMEEVVKNSISMVEFKKTQFLLEESKNSLSTDLEWAKKELEEKKKEVEKERKLNYILISFLVLFIILLWLIWFIKI